MKLKLKLKRYVVGSLFLAIAVVALHTCSAPAHASNVFMGEETVGNKPLNKENYRQWPKIMPVANHKSRVYHTWVNGDERFYYRGDAEKLNQLLDSFGQLNLPTLEIVILPGPGSVSNFDRDRKFAFNCQMHLVGGIAQHIAGNDKGDIFWPLHPRLTIRLDDRFQLGALKIPPSCQIVTMEEIKRRYTTGLTSEDQAIRGWGTSFLADVDPFDRDSLKTIVALLDDEKDWVALNAILSIGRFGDKAREILPRLETIAVGMVEQNAEAAKKVVAQIKAAGEDANRIEQKTRETDFRNCMRKIDEYTSRRSRL